MLWALLLALGESNTSQPVLVMALEVGKGEVSK